MFRFFFHTFSHTPTSTGIAANKQYACMPYILSKIFLFLFVVGHRKKVLSNSFPVLAISGAFAICNEVAAHVRVEVFFFLLLVAFFKQHHRLLLTKIACFLLSLRTNNFTSRIKTSVQIYCGHNKQNLASANNNNKKMDWVFFLFLFFCFFVLLYSDISFAYANILPNQQFHTLCSLQCYSVCFCQMQWFGSTIVRVWAWASVWDCVFYLLFHTNGIVRSNSHKPISYIRSTYSPCNKRLQWNQLNVPCCVYQATTPLQSIKKKQRQSRLLVACLFWWK